MIDPKTGEAVIDPQKTAEALLLPMGGYKGAGLAMILGLLAGTLNGALFGRDCVDFNADPGKVTNTGQFVLALDPARFQPLASSSWKSTATSASCARRRRCPARRCGCPASSARMRRADRLANGLALPGELLTQLDKLAAELAIKPLAAR